MGSQVRKWEMARESKSDPPSYLRLQEAPECSFLFDAFPSHRHGHAQGHDDHHEQATDHPCHNQRSPNRQGDVRVETAYKNTRHNTKHRNILSA